MADSDLMYHHRRFSNLRLNDNRWSADSVFSHHFRKSRVPTIHKQDDFLLEEPTLVRIHKLLSQQMVTLSTPPSDICIIPQKGPGLVPEDWLS